MPLSNDFVTATRLPALYRPVSAGGATHRSGAARKRPFRVAPRPLDRRQLVLALPGRTLLAAAGRSGIAARKREGDGATPAGRMVPVALLWRSDQTQHPRTTLPRRPITRSDGWSDDATDWRYNRHVRCGEEKTPDSADTQETSVAPSLPPLVTGGHERLHRSDRIYDIIVVTDHNQRPRVRGGGSAIFLHIARPGLSPTEGCIAFPAADWRRLGHLIAARPFDVVTPPCPRRRIANAAARLRRRPGSTT